MKPRPSLSKENLSKPSSYVLDTSERIQKEIIQTPRNDNKTFVINLEN